MPAQKREKYIGQVFTPNYIVSEMLDYANYTVSHAIRCKHIMENSCGEGAFLIQIVQRYIERCLEENVPIDVIRRELECYIHGMDNDEVAVAQCLLNLKQVTDSYGIYNVVWDVRCLNTLSVREYDGQMDFVVGNPPYVRVHNLEGNYAEVKRFQFADGGMTDMYLVFFEIGFNMLKLGGKLCYITPSSWLNSLAAVNMRRYLFEHKNIDALVDIGHYQPFEGITTYTMITLCTKGKSSKTFDYYTFNKENLKREFIDQLSYEEVQTDNYFYLGTNEALRLVKKIKTGCVKKRVSVKNGFATLADKCFIGDELPDTFITIPVLKASTGKWSKCLFPYDRNGKPLPKQTIWSDEVLRSYFEACKEELLKGKSEYDDWHLYGRTQALSDVWRDKIAINTLIRTFEDLKIEEVSAGAGVYSGLYIIGDIDIETVRSILLTEEFNDYIRSIKKYKSGGYYTFNSRDVEQFLNYKLSCICTKNEQRRVSESYFQLVS